jgi:hypothetical protein
MNLIGLPFKVQTIEIDNVAVAFDGDTLEKKDIFLLKRIYIFSYYG